MRSRVIAHRVHFKALRGSVAGIRADDAIEIGDFDAVVVDQLQMLKAAVNQVLGNHRAKSANADEGDALVVHDAAQVVEFQRQHAAGEKAVMRIKRGLLRGAEIAVIAPRPAFGHGLGFNPRGLRI